MRHESSPSSAFSHGRPYGDRTAVADREEDWKDPFDACNLESPVAVAAPALEEPVAHKPQAPAVAAPADPDKLDIFGVRVSAATYDSAEASIMAAARERRSMTVTHLDLHALMLAARDSQFRQVINSFDIAAPDGQPVRWSLNWFHKRRLPDRCCGPELMLRLCHAAAAEGVSIYLYGSKPEVLERLAANLKRQCAGLIIAGTESPPFRPLTPSEADEAIDRINASGAALVFIGLGCPRQDLFAGSYKDRIHAVQICVGAAFDFHSGHKKMAPRWMQRRGLEWSFRLMQEPGRLWRRYLFSHTSFAMLLARRWVLGR